VIIARKFAASGGLAALLAVAMAVLVGCSSTMPMTPPPTPTTPPPDGYAWTLEAAVATMEARPPAPAPQRKYAATIALPQPEDFYVIRIPTEGRFSEAVKCHNRGEYESFAIEYLHSTVPFEEWHEPAPNTQRSLIGRYGENLKVTHRPGPDSDPGEYELTGTKIYVRGVPGERVLVMAPPLSGYRQTSCYLVTLTDEPLPP